MKNKLVFEKELPISGGNTYSTEKILNAQTQIDLSNALQMVEGGLDKSIKSSTYTHCYNEWFLIMLMADYFTNLIPFSFTSATLNRACYLAIRVGQIFGVSGIYKIGTHFMPIYMAKPPIYDVFGRLKKCYIVSAYTILSQESITPKIECNKIIMVEGEDLNNLALYYPNGFGFSGIVKWMPFIKQLNNLLRMGYTHSFSFIKTILYNVKDPSAATKEIELYFNPNNPFLVNTNEGGGDLLTNNTFKEFKFSDNDKSKFIEYFEWFLNTYYWMLGRRFNVDNKKERNISSEVEASQDNFEVLQNEQKVYTIDFLNKVSELSGLYYKQEKDILQKEEEVM